MWAATVEGQTTLETSDTGVVHPVTTLSMPPCLVSEHRGLGNHTVDPVSRTPAVLLDCGCRRCRRRVRHITIQDHIPQQHVEVRQKLA